MSRLPALGELLDLLRVEGLAVGVDDHLRVGKLLALETAWSEDQLRIATRSIIAKDIREREVFDAAWTRLFVPRRPLVLQDARSPVTLQPPPRRPLARRLLLGLLAGFGAGLVAATIASWLWLFGGTAPDVGGASVLPTSVALQNAPRPRSGEPSAAWQEYVSMGVLLVGGVLLAGGFVLVGGRARRRRRFVPGPWRYSLRLPEAARTVLDRDDVLDGAAHLTWQADAEAAGDVDVERSAHATAAAGGAPVILYRSPPAAPRYLVLEDTAGGSERWRFLYDELLRELEREGVDVARYTFTGDPSSCMSHDGRALRELRDLVEHCDALIVIGDGDMAFEPIGGTPAEWLPVLQHVPRRLWLNPVPEARWSRGAQIIARGTPMEHAVARGLAALQRTGVDERSDASACPRVIERAPATSVGFAALRDHVGPMGMRAMAAVAVAGAPSIAALRWLNEHFRLCLDESIWLCVATLPWFRSGIWPEGLQARLVAWLQANDVTFADAVAAATAALLIADEPPAGSAAHLRWELDLAAVRMRAGDRSGASAAIRKIGSTALHREIPQRIAETRFKFPSRPILELIVFGAALCVIGGSRLLLATHDPLLPGAAASREVSDVAAESEFRAAAASMTVEKAAVAKAAAEKAAAEKAAAEKAAAARAAAAKAAAEKAAAEKAAAARAAAAILAAPGPKGWVQADSKPSARILVDGVDTGMSTPITGRALPLTPGKHRITFQIGGDKYTFTVTVTAGKTVTLDKLLQ